MSGSAMRCGEAGQWMNDFLILTDSPVSRNRAQIRQDLPSGTIIATVPALAAVLIPEEKSRRCDHCFRQPETKTRRCTGCAEYWYCGTSCQNRHWKTVHKRMCKYLPTFRSSKAFQMCELHKRMDSMLLSHLISEYGDRLVDEGLPIEALTDSLSTFCSLIPLPNDEQNPPICAGPLAKSIPEEIIKDLYSRFNNNNFIVHSHLNSIGHGIFPLASRLFNHSCSPNAIVVYELSENDGISMKVKTLRDVKENEEITIPYFDPALSYQRRQEICRYTYGFECRCSVCTFEKSIVPLPDLPTDTNARKTIENSLLKYVFPEETPKWPSTSPLHHLPQELYCILHEAFLQDLSSVFRDAAHDGPYDVALRTGTILLALYLVLYPNYYPQTGMHCLELAKTAWNASVQANEAAPERSVLLASARSFLERGAESLRILGEEGDTNNSPLREASILQELLE